MTVMSESNDQAQPAQRGVTNIVISCDSCAMRATPACDDCMITAMYGHERHEAVVFDLAEQRAVRGLVAAGLVPALRHREAI
jgi:hypothetical protein